MSGDVRERFAVAAGGEVLCVQPLESAGIRYHHKTRTWRERSPLKYSGMPRVLSRAELAARIGVDEAVVLHWETASSRQSQGLDKKPDLTIDEFGYPRDCEPLRAWGFVYFPRTGVWRRARADRAEVPRSLVVKKTAVAESQLVSWETARKAAATKTQD